MKTPSFAGYDIPEHTQGALHRFIERGCMPGGFLTAVLTNDLFRAVSSADELNVTAIPEVARWVFNNLPMAAYGTEERMLDWCQKVQTEQEDE